MGTRAWAAAILVSLLVLGTVALPAPLASDPLARLRPQPVSFAAVGDSITALSEQGSLYPWQSWVPAATSHLTPFVAGGYAVPGRTTADMLAGTTPLAADVLVIEGAVNDVNLGIPTSTTLSNLDEIAAAADCPRVIVAALPPNDRKPAAALTYNQALRAHALDVGWTFVDPWRSSRQVDGTWMPEAAWDDLHPTAEVAVVAGLTLRQTIRKEAAWVS